MNALTVINDDAIFAALKDSLYVGAKAESVHMVLAYCKAASLDPMTKPVHIVPMSVKKPGTKDYEWRDVIMPGIELYRTKAHRTGEYAGQDEPSFGESVNDELSGVKVTYPKFCRVTVYRLVAGQRVPFSATAYWLETYSTAGKDTSAPNAMWKKRPFGQIEKCAEALALRKAFPEAVGAQPTAEEMDGKSFYIEDEVAPKPSLMPVSKPKIEAPKSEIVEAEFTEQGEIGIHLTDAQKRILFTKAKQVGMDEEALINKFTHISLKNWNVVIKEIGEMPSA